MKVGKINFDFRLISFTAIFCLILYFPLFHQLGRLPIAQWDESLFALRALYTHLNGEYLANFNYFEGMPDHRNTKLPFTSLFQILFLKIIGVNELAIRLPIVLIFAATVAFIPYHFKKRFASNWSGFTFGLIVVTSSGFVGNHMLRFGDHDIPFACYILLSTIFFVDYLESSKSRALIFFTFFSIAAVMTKNLLAGLIAPGLILFVWQTKKLGALIKDYKFWTACFTILFTYCCTIIYFEFKFPGFFQRMWDYELFGRFTKVTGGPHGKPFYYYIELLALKQFSPYFFLFPIIYSIAFTKNIDKKVKNSILCFSYVSFCYLLIISISKTQTSWYISPIFLLVAYIIAIGSIPILGFIKLQTKKFRHLFMISLLIGWLILYCNVLANNLNITPGKKKFKCGLFMKMLESENPEIKQYTIVDDSFGTAAGFYKEMYNNKNQGYDISYTKAPNFTQGQLVMICQKKILKQTNKLYKSRIIQKFDECVLLEIGR